MKNLIDTFYELTLIFTELQVLTMGTAISAASLEFIVRTFLIFDFGFLGVSVLIIFYCTLITGFYITKVGLQYGKYFNKLLVE